MKKTNFLRINAAFSYYNDKKQQIYEIFIQAIKCHIFYNIFKKQFINKGANY